MTDDLTISTEKMSGLLQRDASWIFDPARANWEAMLTSLGGTPIIARRSDLADIQNLYKMRLDLAMSRGSVPNGLTKVLERLSESTETRLFFAVLTHGGHGYMIWLNEDLTRVEAYWQAVDRRS